MSAPAENVADLAGTLKAELAAASFEVPLLPQVASEVLSSTLDDRSNAQNLASLIDKDQGLASHIMRVVNSPGFRGSSDIVSLKQGIARLGMERIREIALTISLKGTLFKPCRFDDLIQQSWELGLTAALWAKEIARVARKNVEIAYLCGLLHNVGVPIVVHRVLELDPEISADQAHALCLEFGPLAGAVLVDKWRLPSVVATCISHLQPDQSPPESQAELDAVKVIEAARVIASFGFEEEIEGEQLTAHDAFQYLNFYPDDVADLIANQSQLAEVVEGMR